ncbi:MAG TPA: tetratricopeptide repeat protein, partial [Planctomycetota bacterium]|nr:tetratricopeptide repeat protein [Planctomycetota bacterium]
EAAAKTYELVAVDFAAEPMAAAQAQFAAAELWRRHGSPAPAEKDFLEAARLDPARFGQRATLEAADMQRRQKQNERALATYIQVVAMDASSSRAQEARLWQARLLQTLGRIDEALAAFATAVEAAERPRALIEAANWLAKALIQKGDLAAAEQALAHADTTIANAGEDDPVEAGRLQKALAGMSARKTLQRAKDKQNQAGKDARQLEDGKKGDNGPRR